MILLFRLLLAALRDRFPARKAKVRLRQKWPFPTGRARDEPANVGYAEAFLPLRAIVCYGGSSPS